VSERNRSTRGTYWDTYLHKTKHLLLRRPTFELSSAAFCQNGYHYEPIPANKYSLHGYFQSSKYFADYADEIRTLFDPTDEIKDRVRSKYADLLTDISACALVHIRRGDYVSGPLFHGILGPDYYERAIRAAACDRLVVMSDDIAWCRTLPFLATATFVDEPVDHDALYLMTHFHKFVISNSTFSWWASWLSTKANKCVIAPDRWFGPKGPQDYQDVYESWWTTVPV
jgi:hypothetical protein